MVVLIGLFVFAIVEIGVAILVADWIGVGWTLVAILAMSLTGVWLLKHEGRGVWADANAEVSAGRAPTRQLLDGAMVLAGGTMLVVPGFVSGLLGLLLLAPPVRALLRPALLAWMTARAARAVRTGRMQGVFIDTSVAPDGTMRTRTTRFDDGMVIDGEGEEVDPGRGELPPG